MSWSRWSRIGLLILIWVAALYTVFTTITHALKNRRTQLPDQGFVAEPHTTPVAPAAFYDVPVLPVRTRSSLVVQRNLLALLAAILLIAIITQLVVGLRDSTQPPHTSAVVSAPAKSSTPTETGLRTSSFEAGIVTPQWQQQDAFGPTWQASLDTIKTQAGASWIELALLFAQNSSSSTTVLSTQSTPLVSSFTTAIRQAHKKGFRVFIVPLLSVNEPGGWAGGIKFSNRQDEQKWFDSYWNIFQPYVQAAAQEGADQLAIATECVWLQDNAPAALWNQLIDRIRSVFTGTLTYDMNWYPLNPPIPSWYRNPNISMIGVSAYIPLIGAANRVDPTTMISLWHDKVASILDTLSTRIGKPVLISEIGYRNTSDALYNTWVQDSTLPADNEEQAGACNAALANVVSDQHIVGIFFWGWEDVGRFSLKGQPALSVLHKYYVSTT